MSRAAYVGSAGRQCPGAAVAARITDPRKGFVWVSTVYVSDGDVGVNAEEPDEMDRADGLVCLVQDAVGPYQPRQQPDLIEGLRMAQHLSCGDAGCR